MVKTRQLPFFRECSFSHSHGMQCAWHGHEILNLDRNKIEVQFRRSFGIMVSKIALRYRTGCLGFE
jgi:hypothetical protein